MELKSLRIRSMSRCCSPLRCLESPRGNSLGDATPPEAPRPRSPRRGSSGSRGTGQQRPPSRAERRRPRGALRPADVPHFLGPPPPRRSPQRKARWPAGGRGPGGAEGSLANGRPGGSPQPRSAARREPADRSKSTARAHEFFAASAHRAHELAELPLLVSLSGEAEAGLVCTHFSHYGATCASEHL